MRPVDSYSIGGAALESIGHPAVITGGLEAYLALEALERAGVQFGITLVVAMVVLGLVQGFGPETVTKSRTSPVISICIGTPALLVLVGLVAGGYMIVGTTLGSFFGLLMVTLGMTVIPILTVLGFVALGQSIASRLGRNQLWAGVFAGSLLSGIVGLSLVTTLLAVLFAGTLGIGAGIRVMRGNGGSTSPSERTVPPANKM
ncbi:hypothetical protein [Natronorubrum daqingense]|uniref:Uncharacterized protein n=1 Tax=Natronorubrum daqingense TaxID=588898 RepID=A0A1N6Y0Y9_9EURY|nr:hypothetical protein [Natronorubrum daqingense]APX95810.1 hypothetical protein BB347_03800 [Natronorubrum daqingense]SIR08238.1 hypothetical protein SAMN05421809_0279 [Natronorubrum daqingense]